MKRARPRFDFSQLLPVVVATSFAAVLTLLLTLGIQRASQLQSASAALQLASELRSLPQYFGTELTLVQRGLEARTFVGEPLADITTAQDGFDKALVRIDADLEAAGLGGSADIQRIRGALDAAWLRFSPLLTAVGGHQGSPYSDTLAGSRLNAKGRALKADVDEALAAHAAAHSRTSQPACRTRSAIAAAACAPSS